MKNIKKFSEYLMVAITVIVFILGVLWAKGFFFLGTFLGIVSAFALLLYFIPLVLMKFGWERREEEAIEVEGDVIEAEGEVIEAEMEAPEEEYFERAPLDLEETQFEDKEEKMKSLLDDAWVEMERGDYEKAADFVSQAEQLDAEIFRLRKEAEAKAKAEEEAKRKFEADILARFNKLKNK